MLLINAKIYTMEEQIIENGYIKIDGKNIAEVGCMSHLKNYDNARDLQGKVIIPGLIDVHTHIGIVEDSISFEGDDCNEDTDPITPQLRAMDAINPRDRAFEESRMAGVTTALVTPGSANAIAGQMTVIKTAGICIDEMIIDEYIGMKFALGENPKSVYNSKNQSPVTRMATASLIRETLFKAREYYENKQNTEEDDDMPDFDMKYEAIIPLFEKKAQAHFHAHRSDDIFTAIRICKEFDINLVLVHATEAYLIPEYIKNYPLIIGPLMTDRSKPELVNLNTNSPKILNDNGILYALSTDHPETPLKYLSLCASLSVKEGVSEIDALKSITINPAKIVGLSDKIGSIKENKHADLVILSGEPLDYKTKVIETIINGEIFTCEK